MSVLTEEKRPSDEIRLLDHGFVRLDDCMASDLSVVNSARVSFGKRKDVFEENDVPLLNYLMRERHGTPFEHNAFRFHVKAPIFVFREWHRHRIASVNEMSARYTELPAEWYIPAMNDVRKRVGKPGHYTYEPVIPALASEYRLELQSACKTSYTMYKSFLEDGIAPEVARNFLHVNHYSEMYWTANLRSIMNFLNLRNAQTAQMEIRIYAEVVEKFVEMWMPYTMEAFVANGRVAP